MWYRAGIYWIYSESSNTEEPGSCQTSLAHIFYQNIDYLHILHRPQVLEEGVVCSLGLLEFLLLEGWEPPWLQEELGVLHVSLVSP